MVEDKEMAFSSSAGQRARSFGQVSDESCTRHGALTTTLPGTLDEAWLAGLATVLRPCSGSQPVVIRERTFEFRCLMKVDQLFTGAAWSRRAGHGPPSGRSEAPEVWGSISGARRSMCRAIDFRWMAEAIEGWRVEHVEDGEP